MDDLTTLLNDAVADVEPTERLAEIRAEAERRRHRWWPVAGGAVLAVAAVVTAVAVVGQRPDAGPGPGPAAPDPTPTASSDSTPEEPLVLEEAAAVYYIGATPDGPRLFREFRRVRADLDPAELVALPPGDPDYRTDWLPGTVLSVSVTDGEVQVAVDIAPDGTLELQQLAYTVTGAVGENLPVQLTVDGQAVGDPVRRDPRVLAPVNISDPAEGRGVTGRFAAQGTARGEGDVTWDLVDGADVSQRSGTAGRTDGDWAISDIDLAGLAPGTYTLRVVLNRPGGGSLPTDTRTITVG